MVCAGLFLIGLSLTACTGDSANKPIGRAGEATLSNGIPAPEFTLDDLSGVSRSPSSYQGKLVLLNFWATWCAPCIAEMPSLERLYAKFKDRGLHIVAVSVDPSDAKGELVEFVKKHGLTFDILRDPEISLPPKYGVSGFPETFFIGPDGQFLQFFDPSTQRASIKVVSDRAWDSPAFVDAIDELLKKSLEVDDTNPS
jgi:peroxiredoxin